MSAIVSNTTPTPNTTSQGSGRRKDVPVPKLADESLQVFKTQRNRFILYQISPDWTSIDHTYVAPPTATYDDFLKAVNKDRIWFATMTFTYKTVSGGQRHKELFISFVPGHLHVYDKFGGVTAASSFADTLKKHQGFHARIESSGLDDLEVENVLQRVSRFELDPVDHSVPCCSF